MELLQIFSIFLEVLIAFLGIRIVLKKKKWYGFGITITYSIYVFYDLSRFLLLNLTDGLMYFAFFVATVSMLITVWKVSK